MSAFAARGPLPIGDYVLRKLTDARSREPAAAVLLLGYLGLWTLYGVLSNGYRDISFDPAEMVAWSREPSLGYAKHPPFGAWTAAVWFAVFPCADWAMYLLGVSSATLALWISWRIAGRYLASDKRALALVLLTFVPFYNFHALRFNANTVLLPLWAATTLCFLRSYETRRPAWAAGAGLCAAAALLGKYWSAVLLVGLALAAVLGPHRAAYFRSPAPLITIGAGAVALAPHLLWLMEQDLAPVHYAASVHVRSFASAGASVLQYLIAAPAYVAVLMLCAAAATESKPGAARDILCPGGAARRHLATVFSAPLILPVLIAPLFRAQIHSVWTMANWTLLPIVLLSSDLIRVRDRMAARIVVIAMAIPTVMVLLAPAIGVHLHGRGTDPASAHAKLLAERIADEWRARTPVPLRLVGGDADLAYGAAFYLPSRPATFADFKRANAPRVDQARIDRDGIALVCHAASAGCIDASRSCALATAASREIEIELVRTYWGLAGARARYTVTIIPPPSDAPALVPCMA